MLPREEDVARLDVAMHDVSLVRVSQRITDFRGNTECFLERQRAFTRQSCRERLPRHVSIA